MPVTNDIITALMHTDSFNDSDRRPKDWREMILYLDPNGNAPLSALMGLTKAEKVTDPEFYWWEKALPNQRGEITGVYTDALSTAYNPTSASIAEAGDELYFKMAAADLKKIRSGHQVILRDEAYVGNGPGVVGYVTGTGGSAANSYIKVKLLQDDIALTAAGAAGTFDHAYLEFANTTPESSGIFWVVGNVNEEGADTPSEIIYEPIKNFNYTQIFRTALSMTRTAMKTKLRTGDHVKQAKEEALKLHAMEMEKALIFGVRNETTGTSGYPMRFSGGLLNMMDKDGTAIMPKNYFSGTWTGTSATGWTWFFSRMEELFRYGSTTRFAFCGSSAIMAINNLAQSGADLNISVSDTKIGMQFKEVITPFGNLLLKNHPLFSMESSMRKSMLIVDPGNLVRRVLDDTQYLQDRQGNGEDSKTSEFLTEEGYEIHHRDTHMFMDNLGG